MTSEIPPVVGNPVRRMGMVRVLRSHVLAATLAVWTLLATVVTGVVVVNIASVNRPFQPADVDAAVLGQAIGQWWVVTMVVGSTIASAVVSTLLVAGRREQSIVAMWQTSLVKPRQIVWGTAFVACAFVLLALVVTLPIPVMALVLGGTSVAQVAVGAAGAMVCGAVAALVAIAVTIRSRRIASALVCCLVILAVPFLATGVRHSTRSSQGNERNPDGVLVANPLVGVADAAALHATTRPNSTAGTAPLTHLQRAVRPFGSGVPAPWVQSLLGALVVGLVALVVAQLRLRRDPAR